jgi:prephenate dehydratase
MDFLKNPKIKLVEDKDTAETARRIQEKQLKGLRQLLVTASEMYDLEILARIQTIKNNMTRFIKKRKFILAEEDINRASLKFEFINVAVWQQC